MLKHDDKGNRISGRCKLCLNVTIRERYTANYWHHLKQRHGYSSQKKEADRISSCNSSSSSTSTSTSTSNNSCNNSNNDEKNLMECDDAEEDDSEKMEDDVSEASHGSKRKRLSESKQGRLGFSVVSSSNLQRFQQLTAETFAKFGLPHALVENNEFRQWIADYEKLKCEPSQKFITRRHLRALILQKGESTLKEILEELRGKFVTLAIDGWTGQTYGSKNTNILALAAGKSYLLWSDRNEDEKDSTDNYLFPLGHEKIEELKKEEIAVCAITTDNAPNMVRIGTLLYQLEESGPVILHLSCSAHSIQLMLQEIVELEPIQHLIKKSLSIIEPFIGKNGKEWRLALRRMQSVMAPNKSPLKLILFNNTRWLSRFECIRRLILLKPQLKLVFTQMTSSSQYSFIHAETFWLQLESVIHPLLNAFKQGTNMVQQDSASLHTLDQALTGIRKAIEVCKPSEHAVCSEQSEIRFNTKANAILNERIKQFVVANGNHYAFWAVSLLTGKKCQQWQSSLQASSRIDYDETVTWLTHWGADATLFYPKLFELGESACKSKLLLVSAIQYQIAEFESGLGSFARKNAYLKNFVRPIPNHSINYDESNPSQTEIDWLLFWNKMKIYAPELSNVAVCLLSLGISEASCERSFSIQQLTHSKVRNRLREDIVQAEMRIRYNRHVLNDESDSDLSDAE